MVLRPHCRRHQYQLLCGPRSPGRDTVSVMSSDHRLQRSLLSFLGKRGPWRAIVAGLAAFVLGFAVFTVLFHFLRPFVWFAVTDDPYPSSAAPLDINSTEWLVVQFGRSSAWFLAGFVTSRWSPVGSSRPVLVLSGTLLFLWVFVPSPLFNSSLRLVLWALAAPIAVLVGAYSATHLERRSARQNATFSTEGHEA
jgi:hypothetical protein